MPSRPQAPSSDGSRISSKMQCRCLDRIAKFKTEDHNEDGGEITHAVTPIFMQHTGIIFDKSPSVVYVVCTHPEEQRLANRAIPATVDKYVPCGKTKGNSNDYRAENQTALTPRP
jgi:hypothetical protein